MQKGTVKFFNKAKGFGFIAQDEGTDLFFHVTEIAPGLELNDGDRVEYEIGQGRKGPCAVKVKKI